MLSEYFQYLLPIANELHDKVLKHTICSLWIIHKWWIVQKGNDILKIQVSNALFVQLHTLENYYFDVFGYLINKRVVCANWQSSQTCMLETMWVIIQEYMCISSLSHIQLYLWMKWSLKWHPAGLGISYHSCIFDVMK